MSYTLIYFFCLKDRIKRLLTGTVGNYKKWVENDIPTISDVLERYPVLECPDWVSQYLLLQKFFYIDIILIICTKYCTLNRHYIIKISKVLYHIDPHEFDFSCGCPLIHHSLQPMKMHMLQTHYCINMYICII